MRAAEVADRHEHLAEQASLTLHDLHIEMADLHRGIERRHIAAAVLHTNHVERLVAREAVSGTSQFMAAVAETVGAEHVGLSLLRVDRTEAVTVASDLVATAAQDLEFAIGEGPAHHVVAAGDPVLVDEWTLAERWPQFARAVVRLGVRSVAAAPLSTGDGCLGALTVFDPPDKLRYRQLATLGAVADALVHTALLVPDSLDPLDIPVLVGADDRTAVHQASGMVAAQLGCDTDDALAVLRARAFSESTTVAAIAHDVVQRKLRLG